MKKLGIILLVIILASWTSIKYPRQKNVIVTKSRSDMKKYIKQGWIVEDVDIVATNTSAYNSKLSTYYTIVSYY